MKKLLSIAVLIFFSTMLYAQKDVTKFLGIPVDGSKAAMIEKLKLKGFHYDQTNDALYGEFNGKDVGLYITTNHDKVWRIMVSNVYFSDENDIRKKFNNLCDQFDNNPKYTSLDDFIIPDEEDINNEMTFNNKSYEAVYYQTGLENDSAEIVGQLNALASLKFTEEQLENQTEETQAELFRMWNEFMADYYSNNVVWFMIKKFDDKFGILLFYDNENNKAHGEDL